MIRDVFSKRDRVILFELVKTDFKLRYQGSFLGVIWSLIKPLLLFAVLYVVFVKFLRISDGTPTYPLVLLLGIALWGFFTEATNIAMQSIVGRGEILRKINFPNQIIVISSMISALISLAINMVVILLFALFLGVNFSWRILLVPVNIAQLFLLAFGVGLFLSALYVKFRDIGHIYEVLLQTLFYSMPIIYPVAYLANFKLLVMGIPVEKIIMLNPLAQVIQDTRHNMIAETVPTTWSLLHDSWLWVVPFALTAAIFAVGLKYFNKNSKMFAEMI